MHRLSVTGRHIHRLLAASRPASCDSERKRWIAQIQAPEELLRIGEDGDEYELEYGEAARLACAKNVFIWRPAARRDNSAEDNSAAGGGQTSAARNGATRVDGQIGRCIFI